MEAITSLRKSLYIKHACSVSASLQAHTVQVTKLHVFHCWVHPLKSGWEQALIWWWQIAERSTERGRDKESPGGKQMYCRCRRAKSTAFILRLCWEKCHLIIRVERPFSATRETRYSNVFLQNVWVIQYEGISRARMISQSNIPKALFNELWGRFFCNFNSPVTKIHYWFSFNFMLF